MESSECKRCAGEWGGREGGKEGLPGGARSAKARVAAG